MLAQACRETTEPWAQIELMVSSEAATSQRPPFEMMGARLHPWTMAETVIEIDRRLDADRFTQHGAVNVAKLVNLRKDRKLREAVNSCDIVSVDGMGIVWGGRFVGFDIPERVTGFDLFLALLELAAGKGERVYLLGATSEVIENAVRNIRHRYPDLGIVGSHHGFFWDEEEAVVREIQASGATMLFVGITSPLKEQFIHRWRGRLGVKFAMGIGGSFDILAGLTRRAPLWMQRAGLEWLFRVIQEPRRLWKRYVYTNFEFGYLLLRKRIFNRSVL